MLVGIPQGATQQCLLDNSETSTMNDFFAADNRSEPRVIRSGTVSPTGSSLSIANFLVPSEWSTGSSAMPTDHSQQQHQQQQQQQQQKPADLPLSMQELAEELRECMVCSTRDRATLLTPCGHIAACQQCTQLLKKCIICRQQVEAYREVRRSPFFRIPRFREVSFRSHIFVVLSLKKNYLR